MSLTAHVRRAASSIEKVRARLAVSLRRLVAARKRRHEQERAFYRELNNYRRAHDLPLVDPEDWKFWYYQGTDEWARLGTSAFIPERHAP